MQSDRITLYENTEFKIELEYTPDYVIWHTAEVQRFTRSTYKKMQEVRREICRFLGLHYDWLWTAVPPDRKDLAKLAIHGGFSFHSHTQLGGMDLDLYRIPTKGE